MRPSEVLHHQAALIDYVQNPNYRDYLKGYLVSNARIDPVHRSESLWADQTSNLCSLITNGLRVAEAYHVQADMMPLIKFASLDLDEDDVLTHDALPTEHGFMVFDDPIITRDVNDKQMTFAAMQWAHASYDGKAGVWIYFYSDIHDQRDWVTQELVSSDHPNQREFFLSLGRHHLSYLTFIQYGHPVGPTNVPTPADYQSIYDDLALAESTQNSHRDIVAIFRLLGQVLVEVKEAPVERPARRMAAKARIPQQVQTVKLRRKEVKYLNRPETDEDGAKIDWQHQWLVRGHWAWRHCGATHSLAEEYDGGHRARIYIAPYWKGPTGAPLVVTNKIFDLAR